MALNRQPSMPTVAEEPEDSLVARSQSAPALGTNSVDVFASRGDPELERKIAACCYPRRREGLSRMINAPENSSATDSDDEFVPDSVAEAQRADFGRRLATTRDIQGPTSNMDSFSQPKNKENLRPKEGSLPPAVTTVSLTRWRRETRFFDGNIMHPTGMKARESEVALAQKKEAEEKNPELEAFRQTIMNRRSMDSDSPLDKLLVEIQEHPTKKLLQKSADRIVTEETEALSAEALSAEALKAAEIAATEVKPTIDMTATIGRTSRVKRLAAKLKKSLSRSKRKRALSGAKGQDAGRVSILAYNFYSSIRGRHKAGGRQYEDTGQVGPSGDGVDEYGPCGQALKQDRPMTELGNLPTLTPILFRNGDRDQRESCAQDTAKESRSPRESIDGVRKRRGSRREDGDHLDSLRLPPSPPFDENFPQDDDLDDESYILPMYQDPSESEFQGFPLRSKAASTPEHKTGSDDEEDNGNEAASDSSIHTLDSADIRDISQWEHDVSFQRMEESAIRRALVNGQEWQRYASGGAEEYEDDAIWTALHAPEATLIAGIEAAQAVKTYRACQDYVVNASKSIAVFTRENKAREDNIWGLRLKLAQITQQVDLILDNRSRQRVPEHLAIHRGMDWLLMDILQSKFCQQQELNLLAGRSTALVDCEEFLERSIRNQVLRIMEDAKMATEEQIEQVAGELAERAIRPCSL